MQIQKEELRKNILEAAEYEFVKRGYKAASLRTIAKKAHTTIGNLYHYFTGKEAILDAIVCDAPTQLKDFILFHQTYDYTYLSLNQDKLPDIETLSKIVDVLFPRFINVELLLSNVTIILLEGCEGTKYENVRDDLYQEFTKHMKEHLTNDSSLLAESIVQSIFTGIIYIAKNKTSMEEGMDVCMKFFRSTFLGLMYGLDFYFFPEKENE